MWKSHCGIVYEVLFAFLVEEIYYDRMAARIYRTVGEKVPVKIANTVRRIPSRMVHCALRSSRALLAAFEKHWSERWYALYRGTAVRLGLRAETQRRTVRACGPVYGGLNGSHATCPIPRVYNMLPAAEPEAPISPRSTLHARSVLSRH